MQNRETLIGNPTGKSPERRVSNPNEGFGNWKDEMSRVKPPTAEEKAVQMQQAREYDAAMVQSVRERMQGRPPEDPEIVKAREQRNLKKGYAGTWKAVDIDKLQAEQAAKKPGFFKRLFG